MENWLINLAAALWAWRIYFVVALVTCVIFAIFAWQIPAVAIAAVARIPLVGPFVALALDFFITQLITQLTTIGAAILWIISIAAVFTALAGNQFLIAWISIGFGWVLYTIFKCVTAITTLVSPGWTGGYWLQFANDLTQLWVAAWQWCGLFCHAWFVAACLLSVLQCYIYVLSLNFIKFCKSIIWAGGSA